MKRPLVFCAMLMSIAASGCEAQDTLRPDEHRDWQSHTMTQRQDGEARNFLSQKELEQGKFGYVRHQEVEGTKQERNPQKIPQIDREQLADIISRIAVRYPGIDDVATLVTDEEVFIAYHSDRNNRDLAAQQIRNTALSVVPAYYDIYISDDRGMIQNIERFQNMSAETPNIDAMLEKVKEEMKKYPQGKSISDKQ